MFEFLIEDWNDIDPVKGTPRRWVVGLSGLMDEMEKAIEDDSYCIAVYEIHQCRFDWTLPRKEADCNA